MTDCTDHKFAIHHEHDPILQSSNHPNRKFKRKSIENMPYSPCKKRKCRNDSSAQIVNYLQCLDCSIVYEYDYLWGFDLNGVCIRCGYMFDHNQDKPRTTHLNAVGQIVDDISSFHWTCHECNIYNDGEYDKYGYNKEEYSRFFYVSNQCQISECDGINFSRKTISWKPNQRDWEQNKGFTFIGKFVYPNLCIGCGYRTNKVERCLRCNMKKDKSTRIIAVKFALIVSGYCHKVVDIQRVLIRQIFLYVFQVSFVFHLLLHLISIDFCAIIHINFTIQGQIDWNEFVKYCKELSYSKGYDKNCRFDVKPKLRYNYEKLTFTINKCISCVFNGRIDPNCNKCRKR